jgi:hypothetical protein
MPVVYNTLDFFKLLAEYIYYHEGQIKHSFLSFCNFLQLIVNKVLTRLLMQLEAKQDLHLKLVR